jgi:hypothetical protein
MSWQQQPTATIRSIDSVEYPAILLLHPQWIVKSQF